MMDSRLLHFYLAFHSLLVCYLCAFSDILGPFLVTNFNMPNSAILDLSDPRILMTTLLLFLSGIFMALAIVTMRHFPPSSSLFQENFSKEIILAAGSPIFCYATYSDSITAGISLVYLILFISALLFYSLTVERIFMALIIRDSDTSQPQCDFSRLYHNIVLRDALLGLSRLFAGIQQLFAGIRELVIYTLQAVVDGLECTLQAVVDGLECTLQAVVDGLECIAKIFEAVAHCLGRSGDVGGGTTVVQNSPIARNEVRGKYVLSPKTNIFPSEKVQVAPYELAKVTNMFDYAETLFKQIHPDEEAPRAQPFISTTSVFPTDPDLTTSTHWGKLASDILTGKWDTALEELNALREAIDSRTPAPFAPVNTSNSNTPTVDPALSQLHSRTWLVHWYLLSVYFNYPQGPTISTPTPSSSGSTPQSSREKNAVREVVKVIQMKGYQYTDPVTQFPMQSHVEFDFEAAQRSFQKQRRSSLMTFA
ncbi:hypothetical protein K435DRAFT_969729 [Dendrothele bispora CBS 962.96]|uniref:Eukaryotic translation initiation factor 3 subunit E N-terminal domain-containing protein n=1 Tax=Dendrothele bispora (strain CBS 962.96) TaxID=1314807 RepID=A0A4S8LFS5_DENBC|nr:hypothetical protein K435DRAFT_969729 [Dendrothele bispora CBS 962.96]